MKICQYAIACFLLAAALASGCSTTTVPEETVSSVDGSKFILVSEPSGAKDVASVRENAKHADEVVVVGRIGGSLDPWVEGRAAFSIVDSSLHACSDDTEEGEACSCQTPWDYCCETDKLPNAMALVKFIESDGSDVKVDAREVFEIKELTTVVIKGIAQRDDAGNLTILADKMFVRK